MRIIPIVLAALLPGGCASLQQGYDDAARRECRQLLDPAQIDACLARVAQNSSERSAARHD